MNEEDINNKEINIDGEAGGEKLPNEIDNNLVDIDVIESTEDGEELPNKDIAKKLRGELAECRKSKEEYLTGWQRAKADYINLQKDLDSARVNISIITREKMTENLLPALDSFEMAFAEKEHWESLDKDWRMGIESIYQQFVSGLKDSGIDKIDEKGIPFNPSYHQSISAIETLDKSLDHTVEKIIQVGYKIGDRVIRPAIVAILEYKK